MRRDDEVIRWEEKEAGAHARAPPVRRTAARMAAGKDLIFFLGRDDRMD